MRTWIPSSKLQLGIVLTVLVCLGAGSMKAQNSPPRSPSETVRQFYKAMREKRFREAFAMSIYKPAVEGLTPQEFDELRPEFERLATAIPENVDLTGEQISADAATVFIKLKDEDKGEEEAEPISLMLVNGNWIIGDRESQAIVNKAGKAFFFNARIDTHHNEVQSMLQRIALSELAYSQQHTGQFGDLAALIAAGLVPKDLEGTDTTGYRFHVNVSADKKAWNAAAEPAEYGRTGKLSFFMDAGGIRSSDIGGKPLIIPAATP